MRRHRPRLTVVLGFLLLSTTGIFSVSAPGAAQEGLRCGEADPQPEHPLEMNTVVSDPRTSQFATPLVKHVIMEKFVYECFENFATPEERRVIRDQEIFIEIVQRVRGDETTTVERRVEEAVCNKSVSRAETGRTEPLVIECSVRQVPVPEVPTERFQCRSKTQTAFPQPTDPVEMNTVITARQDTIITMKVEKEILECAPPDAPFGGFGHLFLFTEIVERRAGAPGADTIRPTNKEFQGILCFSSQIPGRLEECGHFLPALVPPA